MPWNAWKDAQVRDVGTPGALKALPTALRDKCKYKVLDTIHHIFKMFMGKKTAYCGKAVHKFQKFLAPNKLFNSTYPQTFGNTLENKYC